MLNKSVLLIVLAAISVLVLGGCTQSLHGSFTSSTYTGSADLSEAILLGPVEGRSCQTRALYVLPMGERASTDLAVKEALGEYEDTDFLTNVSIDDESYFGVGYARRCIVVYAEANRLGQLAN